MEREFWKVMGRPGRSEARRTPSSSSGSRRRSCGDQNRDTAVGGDGPGVGGIDGDGFNRGGGTVANGKGSGVEEAEERAKDALFEDGAAGGVGGCGEEGDNGGGLVADKRVGGGVEEADKRGEVPLYGDKRGKLGGIGGKELEEGVEGLVLEVDGAESGEEDEVGAWGEGAGEREDNRLVMPKG